MVAELAVPTSLFLEKKLVIVGDGYIGKTSLLISYIEGKMPQYYVPTVFETYVADIKIDEFQFELSLYDTAGQDAYDRLRPLSYPDTDVILMCFSAGSPDSFFNVYNKWLPEIRHFCSNVPIILVCTKVDLRNERNTIANLEKLNQHPITEEEGLDMAQKVTAHAYIECSSLRHYNITEVFEVAAKSTLRQESKQMKKRKHASCSLI